MNALQRAIELTGSQTELASQLCVRVQVVNNWLKRDSVPAGYALGIESITKGAIKAEELCPTFPWHVIRGKPSKQAAA